ncbi:APC family permease [Caproicibacter sp. BJN0012]|uniref:APC family permease n=1 Tax=Caproicibacter sp. BJN0012 TaxID=3110227 RepID=UPI002E10811F
MASTSIRQESKLKKTLGFWDLMGIACGMIIGAGIMSSTGVALGMTGTGVVLAYAFSPILTLICIFPVAIMSAAVPATGGQYRYVSRLLGKGIGTFYLIVYTLMNCLLATYALSFASYLVSIATGLNERIVAIAVLTFFFIANLIGTKTAAILNTVITACLILGLAAFIAFGLGKVDYGYVFTPNNLFTHGASGFIASLALLSSATAGAQFIAELGGEVKDASHNIPKVMVFSTLGVGVLYVLIALVAAGILPIAQVADQPLSLVAKTIMPKNLYYFFIIAAALGATASTLNGTMAWVTKPMLVACEDGLLPHSMANVSRNGVPYKWLIFFYVVGMIPLLIGFNLATVAKFSTANSLISKICICLALTQLAKKYPKELANSSLKLSPKATIVLAIAGTITLVVLSLSLLLNLSVYSIGFLAVAIIFSIVYNKTVIKDVVIPNDLAVDFTSESES